MARTFDSILADGIRKGQIPAREQKAREWYRKVGKKATTITEQKLKGDKTAQTSDLEGGNMYFYVYDAKHKKTLPYYDRFPLCIPYTEAEGGFLGINLHYLPYKLRAVLMDELYAVVSNKKYDETTKFRLSSGILKKASRFSMVKPTIHHYLTNQIRSRFVYIHPAEWDVALFLPVQNFKGASTAKVWADSRKKLK
jgi:hypothetical protein